MVPPFKFGFLRFSGFSRSPFVRGYWPENGKVGNESLSARSDLSTGDVILMFYFDGNLRVLGLRGFSGPDSTLPEVDLIVELGQLRVGGFLRVCRVPVVDRAGSVLAFLVVQSTQRSSSEFVELITSRPSSLYARR